VGCASGATVAFDDMFETFFEAFFGAFAADGRLPVSALVRGGAVFSGVADVAECCVEVFDVGEADFTSVIPSKSEQRSKSQIYAVFLTFFRFSLQTYLSWTVLTTFQRQIRYIKASGSTTLMPCYRWNIAIGQIAMNRL
jgi:hypothetical protein